MSGKNQGKSGNFEVDDKWQLGVTVNLVVFKVSKKQLGAPNL